LRCPFCGSENLIWDFATGAIICASCGSVIDVIYEAEPPYHRLSYKKASVAEAVLYREKTRLSKQRLSLISMRTAMYTKIARRIRKNRVVNERALLAMLSGSQRRVRLIEHRIDELLRQRLNGDLAYLKRYLDIIDNDPVLSSRTFRGKVALAMMIHQLATRGSVDLKCIAKELEMSLTHLKRLEKLVLRRLRRLRV